MDNKNWEKIEKKFDENFDIGIGCSCNKKLYRYAIRKDEKGNCANVFNKNIKDFFKKQFQNQRQEFVDIVKKVNKQSCNNYDWDCGRYYACQEILKELNN